ncbi:MAG: tetratricopeptide repeat protein [Gemmatimonas sp.]|uniref:tetratricopeptide repeat protein n=1 Tax=Gemmatimonas sp. TaxID=1962908 RepID=UPI00391F1159
MADFPSDRPVARPERDAWPHDNHRGLSLAEAGDWAEAAEAFASAADCLARSLPDDRALAGESHLEPLALVLGNLAQACFRLGRLDEALRHAQRACALRVAITGEDGMPVARTRMDIAVMLASGGRLDEATALIQRAIAGIEHRVGEEDERLAPVLENAARIALASGQPANAEPLLLRLHALLDAHDRSTASADLLLAQVAAVRAHQRAAVAVPAAAPERVVAAVPERVVAAAPAPVPAAVPVETPVSSAYVDGFDDASPRVYAHASITDRADWEDQPLRDAVVVTDHLLRITPTGVPVVPTTALLEPPDLAVNDETVDEAEALHDPIDVPDALPAHSLRDPVTERLPSVDPVIESEADGDASMADDEAAVVQPAPISPPEPNAEAAMTPAPARFAPTPAGGQQPVARPPEARVVLPEPTESPGHHRLIAIVAAVVAAAAAGGAAAFFLLR